VIDTAPGAGFRSLGQPTARRIARQAAARGRHGRTLLVQGPPGAGKDAFVDDLLALAFCTDTEPEQGPCNLCRGCRDARGRSHPDLVIGSPERWREMRSTGESIVAAARRWLLEAAGAPVVAPRRVVLIERADRAGEQIQNALLKSLEEPTDRHTYILVADEPSRLLPTIRSRSQPLRIGPVPRADLTAFLMDARQLPADLADTLARLANGLAGTALSLADHRELLEWRRRVQLALLDLLERGRAERFAAVRDLLDDTARLGIADPGEPDLDGEAPRTPASAQRAAAALLLDAWLGVARDLLVAAAGRHELAPSGELESDLASLGSRIGPGPLMAAIAVLESVHAALRENAAPKLALERAMLAWPMVPRRPGS
jgi:hypothetical protein